MALLRLCTLFILLELQHCLPTDHNGLPGRDGRDGVAGRDGKDGVAGKDGREGLPGRNGREGVAGKDGKDGVAGEKGDRGPLPAINLVELQSELQTLKDYFNKSVTELQTLKSDFNNSETELQTLKDFVNKSMMGAQGPPGEFGPAGPSGPKGEKGERGPAGPLPAINLVELQSELQTLKSDFNNSETELQTLKDAFNKIAAVTVTRFQFTKRVGRKYFVSDKKKGSFDEAVKWCSSVGGVPALPTSLEENQALQGLVSDTGYVWAWLSANDRTTEGRFVDLQEKEIQFSKWGSGAPRGGGGQDCVFMQSSTGDWYDYSCGDTRFLIVCEI